MSSMPPGGRLCMAPFCTNDPPDDDDLSGTFDMTHWVSILTEYAEILEAG